MIQYHVYPGGRKRIVTFSYDDGHEPDARLVRLFNHYKVKGTFHLMKRSALQEDIITWRERYRGHEIACHTVTHGWLSRMPYQSVLGEIMDNRRLLEEVAGYPVVGMSYPSGSYSEDVKLALKMCGIVYSRTVKNTGGFHLPDDFMEWHPTCHHRDALKYCDDFLENLDSQWRSPLFYIWGHSHDLHEEEDWKKMELLLQKLSGNDKIWYATNFEIYQYMMAQKALVISADEKKIYNPSSIAVWVEKDKKEIICIPPGEMIE